MRIQSPNFLLSISLRHRSDLQLVAYDSRRDRLPVTRTIKKEIEIVDIPVRLPNKISILVNFTSTVELVSLSLAGIKISNDLISNCLEYKHTNTLDDYLNNQSYGSVKLWERPGALLINLFDPNPFAYHMFIGNKIGF